MWKLLSGASYVRRLKRTGGYKFVLSAPNQQLVLTGDVQEALRFWWKRLAEESPPVRKMLR